MNINFNNVVADLIAKPKTKDKEVLYTRVDGLMEQGDDTNKAASASYTANAKTTANSPNNLRRLFITHKGVYVQYHRLPKMSNTSTLFKEYSYTQKGDSLIGDTLIKETLVAPGLGLKYCTGGHVQKMYNKHNIPPKDTPILNGFGLAALAKPWVYTNIEEIYIDWLPLMSSLQNGSCDISIYYDKCGGAITKPQQVPELLKHMLLDSCGVSSVEALHKKYPRLHTIAYIHELDNFVQLDSMDKVFHYDQDDVKKRQTSWINQLRERGVIPEAPVGSSHAEWKIRTKPSWMLQYTSRDGIYVFDKDILRDYFEGLKQKYESAYTVDKAKSTEKDEAIDPYLQQIGDKLLIIRKKLGEVDYAIIIQQLIDEKVLTNKQVNELFKIEGLTIDKP